MTYRKKASCFALRNKIASLYETKLKTKIASFGRASDGVAAVEFGLVVPLIVFLMAGCIAAYDGFQGSRQFQRGANVAIDLVTRQKEMDDDQFDLTLAAIKSLTGKYSESTDFEYSVTSVLNVFDSDSDPTLTVGWSKANVESAIVEDSDLENMSLPSVPEGSSIMVVKLSASYTPYITIDQIKLVEYERTLSRRPRLVEVVPYN